MVKKNNTTLQNKPKKRKIKGIKPTSKKVSSSVKNPEKKKKTGSSNLKQSKAKQSIFLKALVENRFNISIACKEAGISRTQFYVWKNDPKFLEKYDEVHETRGDEWEEALHRNVVSGNPLSIIFGLKTQYRKRGYGDKPVPSKEAAAIIQDLLDEKITMREAALKLYLIGEQIPEVMKIELEKTPVEPPPPELPPAMDEDELERRYREQLNKAQEQKDVWVPQRREEVQQIKDELKDNDSFAPGVKDAEI